MFSLFLAQNKGLYGVFRIEGTKLVCRILVEKHFGGAYGGPNMVQKNPYTYPKKITNGPPIPIPIPGVSKSLLPGGRNVRKKHLFGGFRCSLL